MMHCHMLRHADLSEKSCLLQVDFKKYAREGFGLHYASILVRPSCSSGDTAT